MSQRGEAQGDSARSGGSDPYADKSVREMEQEIARTREALGSDLDELAWHLSPERFRSQAQTSVQRAQDAVTQSVVELSEKLTERAKSGGSGLSQTLERHSLPVTLVGLGVAVLAVGGGGTRRSTERGWGSAPRAAASVNATDPYRPSARAGHAVPTQPATSGGEGFHTRSRFDSVGAYDPGYDGPYGRAETPFSDDLTRSREELPKRGAGRRARGLSGLLERNPIVAGAVTVLAGIAVGLTLPSAAAPTTSPAGAPPTKQKARVRVQRTV